MNDINSSSRKNNVCFLSENPFFIQIIHINRYITFHIKAPFTPMTGDIQEFRINVYFCYLSG